MNIQERDSFHVTGTKQSIIKVEFEHGRATYSPLHLLIQKNDLSAYFRKNQTYPNHPNMRGYVCEWELINNMLYLISFKSTSLILQKTAQLLQDHPNDMDLIRGANMRIGLMKPSLMVNVQETRGNSSSVNDSTNYYLSEDKTKCVANWFSGNLYVSSNDLQKLSPIKGIKYTFENGILIQSSN